jgi:hypothetical protein
MFSNSRENLPVEKYPTVSRRNATIEVDRGCSSFSTTSPSDFFVRFFVFDLNLHGASDTVGSAQIGGTAVLETSSADDDECSTELFLNQTKPPNANIPARLSNPML